MKSRSSTSGFVPILIIFIVAIVAMGAYFFGKGSLSLSIPISTSAPDVLSKWQTYTDEENGFSFKYPEGWFSAKKPEFLPNTTFFSPEKITFHPNAEGPITVLDVSIETSSSVQNQISQMDRIYKLQEREIKETTVNNSQITTLSGVVTGESYITGRFTKIAFIKLSDGKLAIIQFIEINNTSKDIIDHVISTFNLTKKTSVEGKACGGIAANLPSRQCPEGYVCKLDGNYPDAAGKCTKK